MADRFAGMTVLIMKLIEKSRRYYKFDYEGEAFSREGIKAGNGEIWFPRPDPDNWDKRVFETMAECYYWVEQVMDTEFKSMEKIDKRLYDIKLVALPMTDRDWELISQYMKKPDRFDPEKDVVVYEAHLANNFMDRDGERFSQEVLKSFNETIIGKNKLIGHDWGKPGEGVFFKSRIEKMTAQEAVDYIGAIPHKNFKKHLETVEKKDGAILWLVPTYYMLNVTDKQKEAVINIDGGVWRDMSIGFRAPAKFAIDKDGNEKDITGQFFSWGSEESKDIDYLEYRNTANFKAEALEGSHVFLGAQYGARTTKSFEEIESKINTLEKVILSLNSRGNQRKETCEDCLDKQYLDGLMKDFDEDLDVLTTEMFKGTKFHGSPRNPFGSHCSYKFKGGAEGYRRAWRLHFSQINGGALTPQASGPIRGTVRRIAMIAAAMSPKCDVVEAEGIGPRDGPKSPLEGTYPEKPSDYGLEHWLNPADEDVDPKTAMQFTCDDLNVIKRAAVAEIKRRIKDREEEKQTKKDTNEKNIEEKILEAISQFEIEMLEFEESYKDVIKPYPNEHACRIRDPKEFIRFRRMTRKHRDKEYSVIIGFHEDGSSAEQAYRYKKDVWSEAEASEHCKDHKGKFEPASEPEKLLGDQIMKEFKIKLSDVELTVRSEKLEEDLKKLQEILDSKLMEAKGAQEQAVDAMNEMKAKLEQANEWKKSVIGVFGEIAIEDMKAMKATAEAYKEDLVNDAIKYGALIGMIAQDKVEERKAFLLKLQPTEIKMWRDQYKQIHDERNPQFKGALGDNVQDKNPEKEPEKGKTGNKNRVTDRAFREPV